MSRFFKAAEYTSLAREISAIEADPDRLHAIKSDASERVDADEWARVFGVLADIGGPGGLLWQVAPLIGDLPAGRLDEFATLCRVADAMALLLNAEITSAATAQAAALNGEWG